MYVLLSVSRLYRNSGKNMACNHQYIHIITQKQEIKAYLGDAADD